MVLFLCVSNESTYTKKGTGSRESLLSERTCSFFGDAANAASVRCSEAKSNCMWTHCVRKEANAASDSPILSKNTQQFIDSNRLDI